MEDINIKIKASYIKGIFMILVPLILLSLNVYQFYYPHCSRCSECGSNNSLEIVGAATNIGLTEETVEEQPIETTEPEETEFIDEVQAETTPVENTTEEESVEEPEEDLLPITGNIKLTIDKITYDNKGTWAKVTKIKYTITNQKEDITPKILVYGYDDSYTTMDKDMIEETIVLPELKAGKSITKESTVSITFSDLDVEKTIKLELLRDSGSTVLTSAVKDFTIE